MQNDQPVLQCPNFFCQALNLESHRFCHKCRSPLIKRYLWAVGSGLEAVASGELVGDRYLLKTGQILLDTKPGLSPESPSEIPASWEVYLRLSPLRLHVPQIYGVVTAPRSTLLLLEDTPIYPDGARLGQGTNLAGSLMPKLTSLWQESHSFRRLNWLWQIAQLWEPLYLEKVTSTLLNPELLRVDGSSVRLLDVQLDVQEPPTLTELGQLWEQWQEQSAPSAISGFLSQLCQHMIQGQIKTADQLMDRLDQGVTHYGQGQTRKIQIATFTDQGPSRQSNEDACYPASGSQIALTIGSKSSATPLLIVCDGIGGHEGGEVASELAIATLENQTENLLSTTHQPDAVTVMNGLEQAAFAANDVISQRNDQEHRQERQRMGTTLVMALAHAHELFVTHVGDSRAYRVTRTGCYQVTLDDDVASREVRLGYALYREALRQPASGSLVQALGMSSSNFLHPTVQRFVLDEDCVFLLCSDGLSDHDRVDECWQDEIVPILDGSVDLATASRRLVEIANTRNGHDNVTVGLVHCQATQNQTPIAPLEIDWHQSTSRLTERLPSNEPLEDFPSKSSNLKTQIVQPPRSSFRVLPLVVMLLALLGIGGFLFLLVPEIRAVLNPVNLTPPSPAPVSSSPVPIPIPTISPSSMSALEARQVIQLDRPFNSNGTQIPVLFALTRQPKISVPPTAEQLVGGVVPGTIVRVVKQQAADDRISWVRLEICSVPPGNKVFNTIKPGDFGWQEERTIVPFVTQNLSLKPAQLGRCAPPASSTSAPSATP